MCVAFARGDGPVDLWLPGQPIPDVVLRAATNPGCRWIAHNAAFERAILEHVLTPRHGWPVVPTDRHICTMALALSHAYPGGLDAAATALGLVNRKDVAREKEVKKMSFLASPGAARIPPRSTGSIRRSFARAFTPTIVKTSSPSGNCTKD